MKQIRSFIFAVLHAFVITTAVYFMFSAILKLHLAQTTSLLLGLCIFIIGIVAYFSGLFIFKEAAKRTGGVIGYTTAFYNGSKYKKIIAYIRWQYLLFTNFLLNISHVFKGTHYVSYSRHTSLLPIYCQKCLWSGKLKNAEHGYRGTDDDVEPVDRCPKCGEEI